MAWLLRFILLIPLPMLALESEARADQIPLLIEALEDPNLRQGASIALANFGAAAVPDLRESLESENADVRIWSAYTLGEIGTAAKPATLDLINLLADPDHAVRAASAQALGKIGAVDAIDALTSALDDQKNEVRKNAAVALGQIGSPSKKAVQKLIAALSDPHIRATAFEALIQIGPSTAELLVGSLGDENVRFDVSLILRKVDPDRARELGLDRPGKEDLASLRVVLNDMLRQPEQRSLAAMSLAALGNEGFAILIAAFEQPTTSRIAAEAFAMAGPSAVAPLVDALSHELPQVRATAADALGHIGPEASDAVVDLVGLLKDPERDVRYHVVRALHEFGQKANPAVQELSRVILNSREQEPTRQWAIKTLIAILPESHDAVVKTLIEAANEKTNYGVSQLAREQLRKVDAEAAAAAGIK